MQSSTSNSLDHSAVLLQEKIKKMQVDDLVSSSLDSEIDLNKDSIILQKLNEYNKMLLRNALYMTQTKLCFKNLERLICKQQKAHIKALVKKSKRCHKPSGFNKPSLISDDLVAFLVLTDNYKSSYMSRTEVAKCINEYVKLHNLRDLNNGRIIYPDDVLKKLLGTTDDDQLTYFNLQKFIKHHFIKEEP
jgi:hypothetical protein